MKKIYIFAAIAAILSGFLLYTYLSSNDSAEAQPSADIETVNIVVAAADIPAYTVITEEMLAMKEFPLSYAPSYAAGSFSEIVGLVANSEIRAEEIIMVSKLTEEDRSSLAWHIPEGMRAMTVKTDVETGIGGYVVPGDNVDLLLYYGVNLEVEEEDEDEDNNNGDEEAEVKTVYNAYCVAVVQCVPVLAVGEAGYVSGGEDIYTCLTLALSPEDCMHVASARALCDKEDSAYKLTAVLRAEGDESLVEYELLDVTALFGGAA